MNRRTLAIAGAAIVTVTAVATGAAVALTPAQPTREDRLMSLLDEVGAHPTREDAVKGAKAVCDATKLGLPPYLLAASVSDGTSITAADAAHVITGVIDLYCPNATGRTAA